MSDNIQIDIGYGIIPRAFTRDKSITLGAKAVMSYLLSFASSTGECFPGQRLMAEELGVGSQTVQKYIKELKDKNLLEIEQRRGDVGVFKSNLYKIKLKEYLLGKGKNPYTEKPYTEKPYTAKACTNNNSTSNNNSIPNNNSISNKGKKGNFTPLIEDYTDNSELIEAINDFIDMRKTIKKPPTKRALQLILNKLSKFGSSDEEKIQILERSIVNCWQDVYELNAKWSDKNGAKGDNQGHTRSAGVEEFIRKQEQLQKDSPF